jgi:hypothetical protein
VRTNENFLLQARQRYSYWGNANLPHCPTFPVEF